MRMAQQRRIRARTSSVQIRLPLNNGKKTRERSLMVVVGGKLRGRRCATQKSNSGIVVYTRRTLAYVTRLRLDMMHDA